MPERPTGVTLVVSGLLTLFLRLLVSFRTSVDPRHDTQDVRLLPGDSIPYVRRGLRPYPGPYRRGDLGDLLRTETSGGLKSGHSDDAGRLGVLTPYYCTHSKNGPKTIKHTVATLRLGPHESRGEHLLPDSQPPDRRRPRGGRRHRP